MGIENEGMGSFLNPPGHPEHSKSVMWGDSYMSLSYCLNDKWVPEKLRQQAALLLNEWEANKPPIDRDWVRHVLSYFSTCYSPDGVNRNVDSFVKGPKVPRNKEQIDRHLGVMFIRKYYPEFKPTRSDFQGKKE